MEKCMGKQSNNDYKGNETTKQFAKYIKYSSGFFLYTIHNQYYVQLVTNNYKIINHK